MPEHVLFLLNLHPESWNYYSKLLSTLALAALEILRLTRKDATNRAANRGTERAMCVSSYWILNPEAHYTDMHLILSVAVPQLYAN
jgi:hypothetical protein